MTALRSKKNNKEIRGIGVSAGRIAGPIATLGEGIAEPEDKTLCADADRDHAIEMIYEAAKKVAADLRAKADAVEGEAKTVLETTAQMADDPMLEEAAAAKVKDGKTAARAVWEAANEVAATLAELGGYMAERARDVHDVRDRIVAELTGQGVPGIPDLDHPFILVAHDLAPADTALLNPDLTLALVTEAGGPTSHTAILARSLAIPAVVAARGADDLEDGQMVIVDGVSGIIEVDPDEEKIAAVGEKREPLKFTGPGQTKCGHKVQILANVGDPASAAKAAEAGAEGVGLFRTEFCFLGRDTEPSVEEQTKAYCKVLEHFPGQKVVIRTLDAGADKPLPFVTNVDEENPALGVRGWRISRKHPEVVDRQLDAIGQAAQSCQAKVWVMAPMISAESEIEDFVQRAHARGLEMAGMMIEVPAAALRAPTLFAHAGFASIGTNDLTQYTMAADRMLGDLADLTSAWQPALLELIRLACAGGDAQDRPVGVCGEAAADPALAVVLVGLGVSSLSMAPVALGDVAAVIGSVTLEECRRLAGLALAAPDAISARDAVRAELPKIEELGL